uniref:Protein PLASTID MOVEMENT IMPAIRED 2 n=1 Tax=Leersia perrieri TaxID=77586 RepID=A0A0D9V4E6_9ORYZ
MEATMDQGLGRSESFRATMSIFGESISGRKAEKNKGFVPGQENLSSEIKQLAQSGLDKLSERKASVDKERAGAESELSRARAMAKELERQIEQATSQRSELQAMWSARTRKKETNVPGTHADAQYTEVAQELDQAKRELLRLRLEVRAAAEAKAKAESDIVASVCRIQSSLRAADEMKRQVEEANEEHVLVELARMEAERERREIEAQRAAESERFAADIEAARARVSALRDEASHAREMEAKLAVTNSDVAVLQAEMEFVRAMEKNSETTADATAAARRKKKNMEEAQDKALLQAAEAELDAARKELEAIKAGSFQFMTSMDRTRTEIMRVADEISNLKAKEKRADAQVQQLNAKLLKARARLEVVTAADERSKAIVSNLAAAMKQLKAEAEAARKEEDLTKLEKRCVIAEAENIEKEIATAEARIKLSVKELDAAKWLEAEAMRKLRDTVENTMQSRAATRRTGTITVSRFEYEYLTGRAALVRVVADKKVAAAQAWVQALKASEKEAAARAEALEREVRETEARVARAAAEAEKMAGEKKELEQELYDLNAAAERDGLQCAYPRRRSSRMSVTGSRRSKSKPRRSSVSAGVRNPRSPSFTIKRKRKVMPNLLKLIKERRGGKSK